MKYILAALTLSCALIALTEAVSQAETLACPQNPYYFETERSEPLCQTDADCAATEKCCWWSSSKHCLVGISTASSAGSCPPSTPHPMGILSCRMDYGGCQFDSECSGDQKCCANEDCGYKECKAVSTTPEPIFCTLIACGPAPGPECQLIEEVRPNGDGCDPVCAVCADPPTTTTSPPPRACTKRGCGAPPAGPDCHNVTLTYPNGPGCGACQICEDTPTTPPAAPIACTRKGCDRAPAGADCQDVMEYRPNGAGCAPVCTTCADEPAQQPPRPCTLKGCGAPPAGPDCQNVIETYPNGPGCGVCRICLDPTPPPRFCTEIGCGGPQAGPDCQNVQETRPNGPGCGPVCRTCLDTTTPSAPTTTAAEMTTTTAEVDTTTASLTALACPDTPFFYGTRRSEPRCEEDSQCQPGEKCCWWGRNKHCLVGIPNLERPGSCPRSTPSPLGMLSCKMDYSGCQFDGECPGDEKCCQNADCGYKECKSTSLFNLAQDSPLCQMVWSFECNDERPPHAERWHYWPSCGYVRRRVCDQV